jgi:hypothetical protein
MRLTILGERAAIRGRETTTAAGAEQGDAVPPLHSITSSARARRVGGTVRSSAFAVFRLMTSSNLVGC